MQGASTVLSGQLLSSLWIGYQDRTAWLVLALMAASGAGAAVLQSRVRSDWDASHVLLVPCVSCLHFGC